MTSFKKVSTQLSKNCVRARGQSCNLSQVFWPALYTVSRKKALPELRDPRLSVHIFGEGKSKGIKHGNSEWNKMGWLCYEWQGSWFLISSSILIYLWIGHSVRWHDIEEIAAPPSHLTLSSFSREWDWGERERPASILWTISPKGLINPSPSNFRSILVSACAVVLQFWIAWNHSLPSLSLISYVCVYLSCHVCTDM